MIQIAEQLSKREKKHDPGRPAATGSVLDSSREEEMSRWERFKKHLALRVLRMGIAPYKLLTAWGNRTLDYEIGEFSYGAPRVMFPHGKLKIGKFCSISWDVTIFLGGNHRFDWIATYPFPHSTGDFPNAAGIKDFFETSGDVTIGNDVWIGSNVLILSGVTIADGAVIGAGSVVTGDVGPYEIVAGNPARSINKRFGDEAIAKLLQVKWWDWPLEKINAHLDVLCSGDIDRLMEIK
ncbi:MAG TPA: CatB-related O-acetyltransferase [Candidatus Anoxymicrobiaceae bacterium]